MDSFSEFYDAAKTFDDFLGEQNESVDESYLLGQSVLMHYGEQSGLDIDYRETDDFDLAVPCSESVRNIGDYGMFYGGEANIQFDDFNIDILSSPNHPTLSELEQDWEQGDEILEFENYSPRIMSPQLFHDSKVRMAQTEVDREKDLDDIDKMAKIIESLEE